MAEGNQRCRLLNNIEKTVGKARLNKEKDTAACRVFLLMCDKEVVEV